MNISVSGARVDEDAAGEAVGGDVGVREEGREAGREDVFRGDCGRGGMGRGRRWRRWGKVRVDAGGEGGHRAWRGVERWREGGGVEC